MSVTFIILGINLIVSFLALNDRGMFSRLLFSPYIISRDKDWKRFFTHAFVHVDYVHLAFNMFSLYMFGEFVEITFQGIWGFSKGTFFYLLMYFGAIMLSSFPSFEKHKNNSYYSAVGASGAVSAVVFAAIFIYPTMPLRFIFIPIEFPGFVFGAVYLIYSWYMAKKGVDNIGHDAHFWGALFGVIFTASMKFELVALFFDQIRAYFLF